MNAPEILTDPRIQGLRGGYPSRGAAYVLADRVREVLTSDLFSEGDRFLTDDELVEITQLSRSTIRRALGGLRERGWLRSQAGLGTFVGILDPAAESRFASSAAIQPRVPDRVRLGLIAFGSSNPSYDWINPLVLQGIQQVSDLLNLRVELVPGMTRSEASLQDSVQRIESMELDSMACLSVDPSDALLVQHASDRGVRCFIVGTEFPQVAVPRICEDNRGGMDRVVRELHALGHERIGLVMRRWAGPWLFKRHEQWYDTRRDLGLDLDEGLMHWLPQQDQALMAESTDIELLRWIERTQPTAVICGHWAPASHLGKLLRQGAIRIPRDFALAMIDQYFDVPRLLGFQPATLAVPLEAIGQALAHLAARWKQGQTPPSLTKLPMTWTPGESLRPAKS